ncbi:ABC transporter substrate-binding protein [Mesorhizobium sp. NBSH29]|uniref:ABC transporter substrate-binding protein n=1 Tax=Mesorhizobium sp. NBSH29 TaxID=2654249 RepID=UPI0021560CCA|nr:ABC transporter substrate-binding protein [Mesorhizobium sp. NBSH29]
MKSLLTAAFAAMLAAASGTAFADTLQVGAYPSNPPWEFKNEQSMFEGFEVDLVNEIGKRLGAEIVYQDLGFQALFAATSSGRIDMAISTITITDERLQSQSFTQGYYDSDLALIATKDGEVKSMADMKGKTVGVLSSSIAEKWANENKDKAGFEEIRGYPEQQNLLLDVQSGRLAGAVGDIAGYQYAFKNMPTMQVLDRIATGDRFAIMMPKGSKNLERVNEAVSAIKNDGTLAKIHEKWLGAPADPETSTVKVVDMPVAK